MPYQRDERMNDLRQQRAAQIRRRYRQHILRNRLKGGTDHDRSRTITQEQLEHAHDSNAYDLAMYEANQDTPTPGNRAPSPYVPPPGGNQPSQSPHDYADGPASQSSGQGSSEDSGKQSESGKKDVKDNSPADRAPVTNKRDLASDANDEEPAAEAVWQDYTPLTPGQQMHVDNLLSIETDNLAREVLITLKREGLPPNDQWREFLEQYALTGWYAASDAIAWATLAKIANSDWDETLAYADKDHVETAAQDLGDNAIEGVVVIDAETGDTLFDRTAVVRADGSQYVGMQDTERDALLAEERESYIPLTPGQAHVVDELLTQKIGSLDRKLLNAVKRDGLPPENQWNEYIAQLEMPNGEETSDAQALATLDLIASSDWNEFAPPIDSPESVLLPDERESYIPLTPGQAHVVDELLTQKIGSLDRKLLNAVKRDGLPPENQWNEYIAQLEMPNGEETSDAQALATLDLIASSDWNEFAPPIDSPESVLLPDERESYIPLTPGQAHVVDELLTQKIGSLDRELLNAVKRDGLPPENQWNEYIAQLEIPNGEETSDAQALATLDLIASSDWNEFAPPIDSPESVLLPDERESYIPLTPGQAHVVDELLTQKIGSLDRELLNAVKRDGLPPENQWNEYIAQLEIPNGEETSDAQALATLDLIASSDWNEFAPPIDSPESIHLPGEVVANGNQLDYEILPIIPDEVAHGGNSNIEVSDSEWADRTGRDDDPTTKRGVLSRDYNHEPDEDDPERIHKPFRLQSPVVGPDVRVEFVVRGHGELGNYVVISFPASYYQSEETIMSQLAMQDQAAAHFQKQSQASHLTEDERWKMQRKAELADHNPDRWHEDGRIFYAFAHLSQVSVNAGEIIDSRDKAIIGMTGKSGTGAHHLDLAILYVGSSIAGSGAMDKAMFELGWDSGNADLFFGFSERSQLYPTNDISVLYGENLDSARLHPELDESGIAEFMEGYSIYAEE